MICLTMETSEFFIYSSEIAIQVTHGPVARERHLESCMAAASLDDCVDPSRHRLDESPAQVRLGRPPFLFKALPERIDRSRHRTVPDATFRSAQRCSIGFRSRLCDGQGSVATWYRASQSGVLRLTCLGSLSCWNVYGASEDDRSHPLEGSICRSRISTYTAEFIFMKMRHALPTPRADMQPHIKSAPPPNF